MDYSHMTAAELRTIAKEKGVKKASSLKKQELIEAIEALEKEAAEAINETVSEEVQDAEVQNEEDGTEAVAVNEGEDTEPGEGPGAEGEEGSDENKAFVPPFKKNDAAFVKGDIKEGGRIRIYQKREFPARRQGCICFSAADQASGTQDRRYRGSRYKGPYAR